MKKLVFTVFIVGSVVFFGDYLVSNLSTVELSTPDEMPSITNVQNTF